MIQLRVRTEFSFRRAYGPLPKVVKALNDLGTTSAAIVDMSTWGHVRWDAACKKASIKPMFGTEFKVPHSDGREPVAWAIAEDTRAFYRFSSAVRMQNANVLEIVKNAKGVIRFAGSGLTHPDTFDYIDLNPSNPLAFMNAIALHNKTKKPLVITGDNYYPTLADYEIFLAMGGRERMTPQHILSLEEMRAACKSLSEKVWRQAIKNGEEVANRAAHNLAIAPLIQVKGDFRKMVEVGRKSRLARKHLASWPKLYADRLKREIETIEQKKYQSYFLVVADLVNWAKGHMLVGPGRGSSAGSLLCYLTGITEVDPIPHGLLFERFVDLNRNDLPDIDIDFSDTKREMVFEYLGEKYGKENVSRIGNISTLQAKSVLAQACRRLGIPDYERFNLLNVLVTHSSGDERYGKGIEDTFINTEIGRSFIRRYPAAALATQMENHADHTSVHAAGVIVSMEPVTDFCTVGPDGVAHIDKPDAEKLNLLKIDALGLRTLGIIEDAGVITNEELFALKLDDPKVLDVFNRGKFAAVFQFEGAAVRQISAQVTIDSFRSIDNLIALARPGPLGGGAADHYIKRKAGTEKITTGHPLMTDILADTYGVVLYQEQIMRAVRELGGFSWEDTSTIRKAMSGRKGEEYFNKMGETFIKGAAKRNISRSVAQTIWSEMCTFGAWGFNKCISGKQHVLLARRLNDGRKTISISELAKRKRFPAIWSLKTDKRVRWTRPLAIHYNGKRNCFRYVFDDGSRIDCTKNHKFIINGNWKAIGNAKIGNEFASIGHADKKHFREKLGIDYLKGRKAKKNSKFQMSGENHPGWIDGRFSLFDKFKNECAAKLLSCEDCDKRYSRMEVHHNDFKQGIERPDDLSWLCPSCHAKRHRARGQRLEKGERGRPITTKRLAKIIPIGVLDTYDIEMPAPNHNFILANGIVTHNSHSVAYGVISYWTAYLKAYHPLEFAAACLRGAKDDNSVMDTLREMSNEGVEYVPFDINKSDINWTVQDGKLIGGFLNLDGIGPSKAKTALEARAAGRLDKTKFLAMTVKFSELYPLMQRYAAIYKDPEAFGCAEGSRVLTSDKFPDSGDVLYIGKLQRKRPSDANEAVRVAKRGGKVLRGNTLFVDFECRDDMGEKILCRVDRQDWEEFGKHMNDRLIVGDDLMIRGRRIPGYSMITIIRLRCLNRPEAL